MAENFDMKEINKFLDIFDEYCTNNSSENCAECPFNSIPCGVVEGNKLKDFAKLLHDWFEDRPDKSLTEAQLTFLKALNTLGYNYVAKDSDGNLMAYRSRPLKKDCYWMAVITGIGLTNTAEECSTLLSPLCDWKDEKPLNIVDSLIQKKAVYN